MLLTDLSIDLETLGVTPGCVVTQIGLCSFNARDPNTKFVTTQIGVDPQSCLDAGMRVEWGAIQFWMGADDEARATFAHGYSVPIKEALEQLGIHYRENHYLRGHPKDEPSFSLRRVWGHGPVMDVALVEAMYRYGKWGRVPWKYDQIRDTRTLKDLVPNASRPEPKVKHVAAYDAEAQARWIVNMYAGIAQQMVEC